MAALGLCCSTQVFSSSNEWRLLSSCSAVAFHCSSFSCCWAGDLGMVLVVVAHGLSWNVVVKKQSKDFVHPCPHVSFGTVFLLVDTGAILSLLTFYYYMYYNASMKSSFINLGFGGQSVWIFQRFFIPVYLNSHLLTFRKKYISFHSQKHWYLRVPISLQSCRQKLLHIFQSFATLIRQMWCLIVVLIHFFIYEWYTSFNVYWLTQYSFFCELSICVLIFLVVFPLYLRVGCPFLSRNQVFTLFFFFSSFLKWLDPFFDFIQEMMYFFLKGSIYFLKSLLNLSHYRSCFMFRVSWPWGMWNLSSLTRDQTSMPCTGRQSLNHSTSREVLR